jgi:DNA-binding NarL/FixJ family response regulator
VAWSAVVGVAWSAVLLAQGRAPEAVEAAREALGAAPFTAARARLAEGRALAAAGDRRAAVEALTAAESALDGFGAIRRRDEAVRELRRLGHRVLRPAREPAHGPLTARELEIAELVAAGRTNKEIAEQLVLSPRTIEAHLRNIYGKLGVRSRVELAHQATLSRPA